MIYHSRSCYVLVKYLTTLKSAEEHCRRKFNAYLVEINSWAENSAVARLALRTDLWIGLEKFKPQLPGKKGWEWIRTGKGNEFLKSGGAWAKDEPNGNGGHGSRGQVEGAIIWGQRKYKPDESPAGPTDFNTGFFMQWDDRGIDSLFWFVCEKGKFKRSLGDQPCIR